MTDARITNDRDPDRDPLEAELESLRPTDLPPALVARIGAELSHVDRPHHPRGWWLGAAAAAAACVAVAAIVWRATHHSPVHEGPIVDVTPVARPATSTDFEPPALATYHRALAGKPGALDELLDRQAAAALPVGPRVTASSDFAVFH